MIPEGMETTVGFFIGLAVGVVGTLGFMALSKDQRPRPAPREDEEISLYGVGSDPSPMRRAR